MGWLSFFKKREPGDIEEARFLERLEIEVAYILRYIQSYIDDYHAHKEWYMDDIRRAMSRKEAAVNFIRSSNTQRQITNPSYRSSNAKLIDKIEGIFSVLKTSRRDIVTIEQAEYMKKKCQEVIDEIKALLREI